MRKEKQEITFTAKWEDTQEIIYEKEPFGNLFGALPKGTKPIIDERWNDILCAEEWWNGARFISGSGRTIIVRID